jgi:hypothetical protein
LQGREGGVDKDGTGAVTLGRSVHEVLNHEPHGCGGEAHIGLLRLDPIVCPDTVDGQNGIGLVVQEEEITEEFEQALIVQSQIAGGDVRDIDSNTQVDRWALLKVKINSRLSAYH